MPVSQEKMPGFADFFGNRQRLDLGVPSAPGMPEFGARCTPYKGDFAARCTLYKLGARCTPYNL